MVRAAFADTATAVEDEVIEATAETTPIADEVVESDETSEIVVVDEETMTLINTITGEVVGIAETPPEGLDDIKYAEWIGERIKWHEGKQAGLEAEKQLWIDTICNRYDTQIKRHKNSVAWIKKSNESFFLTLAKKLIGDGKRRSAAVGLLLLKLTKKQPSLEIVDEDFAVSWIKVQIQEARFIQEEAQEAYDADPSDANQEKLFAATAEISKWRKMLNRKTTIYKSEIPKELKPTFTEDKVEETGMLFHEGGEDILKIE